MYRHIIPKGQLSAEHKRLARDEIDRLDPDRAWIVQIKRYTRKRSVEQNAFLHAVPLRLISEATGYTVDDVKTYLLGEAFGWVEYEVFGELRRKPAKRSHELNTSDFSFFMEFCEQWGAQELGLIIPRPNEYLLEEDMKHE